MRPFASLLLLGLAATALAQEDNLAASGGAIATGSGPLETEIVVERVRKVSREKEDAEAEFICE